MVADVDNNGKNEVIAAAGSKIYMWETNGNPNSNFQLPARKN